MLKASSKTTDDMKEGGQGSSVSPDDMSSLMQSSKAATAMTLQSSKCEELPMSEGDMSESSGGLGMESATWSSDDDLDRGLPQQEQLSASEDSDDPPDINMQDIQSEEDDSEGDQKSQTSSEKSEENSSLNLERDTEQSDGDMHIDLGTGEKSESDD